MQAYQGRETRQSGVVLVVAIHALLIYAAWTGLQRVVVPRSTPPIDLVAVPDIKPPEPERTPAPPLKLSSAPQVVIPMRDIVIEAPTLSPPITATPTRDTSPPTFEIGRYPEARDGVVTAPVRKEFKPAYRIEPTYPRQAQRDGMNGSVIARIHVAPNGTVGQVEIVSASNRMFEREVARVLSQWRFNPEPVGFIAEYEINFRLRD